MKYQWARIDEHGVPRTVYAGSQRTPPEGSITVPPGVKVDLKYWSGDAWLDRPLLPNPEPTADGFAISPLPEGSKVSVIDLEAEMIIWEEEVPAAEEIYVFLPLPGVFKIEVEADGIWLPSSLVIGENDG